MKRVTVAMCRGNEMGVPYAVQKVLQEKLNVAVLLTEISVTDGDFCYRDRFFNEVYLFLSLLGQIEVLSHFNYDEITKMFKGLYEVHTKEELEDWKKC